MQREDRVVSDHIAAGGDDDDDEEEEEEEEEEDTSHYERRFRALAVSSGADEEGDEEADVLFFSPTKGDEEADFLQSDVCMWVGGCVRACVHTHILIL